jgi:hypothetical protein
MFASRFIDVARIAPRSFVRQMSAHRGTPAEMRADVNRWRNISIGKFFLASLTCAQLSLVSASFGQTSRNQSESTQKEYFHCTHELNLV